MQHTALVETIQSALRWIYVEEPRVREAFAATDYLFCPSRFTVVEDHTCELLEVDFGYVGVNVDELSITRVSELRATLTTKLLNLAQGEEPLICGRSRQRYFNRDQWAADMVKLQGLSD